MLGKSGAAMVKKKCSRDTCPTGNVAKEYSAKCGRCDELVHLPCIGIHRKVSEVMFHVNIKIYCMQCIDANGQTAAIVPKQPESDGEKLDSIIKKLDDIGEIVKQTNGCVKQQQPIVNKQSRPLFSQIAAGLSNGFPSLGVTPLKRKRVDDAQMSNKKLIKSRPLTVGTNNNVSNNLGGPVNIPPKAEKPKFAKPIYVSRLQPTVDVEQMKNYVKNNIAGIADNELSVRLLVRREQDVSLLTYVSFRLACAEKYIDTINDPKFWPSHVMIGEFVEQQRPLATLELKTPAKTSTASDIEMLSKNDTPTTSGNVATGSRGQQMDIPLPDSPVQVI